MLFVHEVHEVRGRAEDEFEAAIRDEWMPMLAKEDDARLLWFLHWIHGTGPAYHVVTVTGDRGSWTLPALPAEMADNTVWVPTNSFGRGVWADLASPGSTVTVVSTSSTAEEDQ